VILSESYVVGATAEVADVSLAISFMGVLFLRDGGPLAAGPKGHGPWDERTARFA